jgi:DNA-binding NarL/FixJ family response regulator
MCSHQKGGKWCKIGKDSMIRLVLVDDQATVRQGLKMRLLLEPDITIIGEASSGKEALAIVPQLLPDVVLMDIEMPEMDGIAVTTTLHSIVPQSVTVMLSIHSDNVTRARAQKAGAKAFVEKSGSTDELLSVIRQACQKSV